MDSTQKSNNSHLYEITSEGNIVFPASMSNRQLTEHLNIQSPHIDIFEGINSTQRTSKPQESTSKVTETETTNKKTNLDSYKNLQETIQNKESQTNVNESVQTDFTKNLPHVELDKAREDQYQGDLDKLYEKMRTLQVHKRRQKDENLRLEEEILRARKAVKSNRKFMSLMKEELGHVHNQNKMLLEKNIKLEGKMKIMSSKRARRRSKAK